jgi:hypothetical protein
MNQQIGGKKPSEANYRFLRIAAKKVAALTRGT